MKKLIVLIIFLSNIAYGQQSLSLVVCDNISEMLSKPVHTKAKYWVVNAVNVNDGLGGVYYYDSLSTEAVDNTYWNVVKPTSVTVGRFKRANTRNVKLTQGMLEQNGGVKTLTVLTTLNVAGEATVNLTYDNTATGTKIFTDTPVVHCTAQPNGTTANNMIIGQPKSFSADQKQITVAFSRGNEGVLAILLGLRAAPAGTPVAVIIKGM